MSVDKTRINILEEMALEGDRDAMLRWILLSRATCIIAFSGGKDSIAMVLRAIELGIPKEQIELWHHEVDGDGEQFYDWSCTKSYCIAFAKAMGLKLLFSYAKGGILREMHRDFETIQPVYFQTEPEGEYTEVLPDPMNLKHKTGRLKTQEELVKDNTRGKFPQVAFSLNTRWCSWIVKIGVMVKAINNSPRFKNANMVIMTGERRGESTKRAEYNEIEKYRSFTQGRRSIVWRSVIDFKCSSDRNFDPEKDTNDVWDIMKRHKIQPHPCYMLGYSRCSCMICIFGTPDVWASTNEIAPERVARVAAEEKQLGQTLYHEKKKGKVDIYEAKVNVGKSFIKEEAKKRWMKEALSEFTSPIFVDDWQMPAGAFNREIAGAN